MRVCIKYAFCSCSSNETKRKYGWECGRDRKSEREREREKERYVEREIYI